MGNLRLLLSRDDYYHQRGYWVVAKILSNAGIEVILGGIQTPSQVVQTALSEDIDIIGYRIMNASPKIMMEVLFDELKKQEMDDIPVIVGGIVSPADETVLKKLGVKAIFRSFDALEYIQESVLAIGREARQLK